ncbi:hypothetical protein CEXT_793351 [Caerostris extrusa]|uniref:Uncharacterized protein n=1 Tax=Caerostris extrusa TaxID=172846 RepID=A0AAV4SVF2_CAEEX|nr:hypothetical protein CEXT_793351 [Caerostris extrusa]
MHFDFALLKDTEKRIDCRTSNSISVERRHRLHFKLSRADSGRCVKQSDYQFSNQVFTAGNSSTLSNKSRT